MFSLVNLRRWVDKLHTSQQHQTGDSEGTYGWNLASIKRLDSSSQPSDDSDMCPARRRYSSIRSGAPWLSLGSSRPMKCRLGTRSRRSASCLLFNGGSRIRR